MSKTHPQPSPEDRCFDIIIVGGGTAGCVLASRLSSFSQLQILLLEAGPNHNNDLKVTTPLSSRRMFNNPAYDWGFATTPQAGLENRVIQQTRGRMIGGSSAINSHSLVYPNKAMHDAWAEISGDGRWSWEGVKDCYRKFQEVQIPLSTEKGGTRTSVTVDGGGIVGLGGPIQASYPRQLNVLQRAWENVFRSLDAESHREGMSGEAIGGTTTANAIDSRPGKGERSHAGNAYLEPVIGRENLVVETEALVEKVFFQDRGVNSKEKLHAIGVRYEKGGKSIFARANRDIILCAGTFGNPQILELSGIGRRRILEDAGVECLLDLPEVGENLQDHLNYGPSIEVNPHIETLEDSARDPVLAAEQAEEYEKHRTGPLSEGAAYSFTYWPLQLFNTAAEEAEMRRLVDTLCTAEASTTSSNSKKKLQQQLQYEFNRRMILSPDEASATVFMTRKQRYTVPGDEADGNYMSVVAMLSHPFSRGSTHISTSDPRTQPVIDAAYLSHPLDLEILARHVLQIERLLEQPTYTANIIKPNGNRLPKEFNNRRQAAGVRKLTVDEAKAEIKRYAATNYHPCGTCAMGKQTAEQQGGGGGVTDGDLRVHETVNLRVCDASVFPIIPRGNILTTVYAVAEKGAEGLLEDYYV